MAYNAGEAYLQIIPSFQGVADAIDREAAKWGLSSGTAFADAFNRRVQQQTNNAPLGPSTQTSAKQGDTSGGAFADGFKARVDAALKALPDIQLRADSSDADARIASLREKLAELSSQKIGIDISEADAIARIDDIKRQLDELGADSASVSVRLDTAAASAQLDKLLAEIEKVASSSPDVDVKANTGDAEAKLAATKAAADSVGGSSPNIDVSVVTGPALAGIGIIKTALLGLSAGAVITPLLGGVAALLGPLAAVGGGIAGIAAVGVPAISNVNKALAAQTAAEQGAGRASQQSAAQQQAAAAQIAAAKLSLADTERRVANDQITSEESVDKATTAVAAARSAASASVASAAQQVVTAEQNVATAQKASLAAQQALTDARDAAARSLQDSAFSAQDANLTLQADQIAVIQAQQNLDAVNASSTSTDLQKQQATLQLAQAQQALTEQQVTLQRATQDNNTAQAAGVAGSAQVVAAQQKVTSTAAGVVTATGAVTSAQQAEAAARTAGAAQVQTAEQALADARRAQALQQAQDASSLIQAQAAVANAQRSAAQAANAQTTASSNLGAALAKLTPLETVLFNAVKGFKAAFADFRTALEPSVIPLFTGGLNLLADLLPKLEPLIRATADALAQVEKGISGAVNGAGFATFVKTLTSLVGPAIAGLSKAGASLAGVFAHVVEAFAPISGEVLSGLDQLTSRLNGATQSPGLAKFVQTIGSIGPLISKTIGDVGGLLSKIVGALAPLAGPVLSVVDTLAKALAQLVTNIGGPLQRAFSQLAPIFDQLIVTLLPPLSRFLTSIIGDLPSLARAFSAVLEAALPILPVLAGLASAIAPILEFLAPLTPLIIALVAALKIWTIVQAALDVVLDANPIGAIIIAIAALVAGVILAYQHSATFRDIVQDTWTVIKTVIVDYWTYEIKPVFDAFVAVLHGLTVAFSATVNFLVTAYESFTNATRTAWAAITGVISTAWNGVTGGLKTAYSDAEKFLTSAWSTFVGTVKSAWAAITSPISSAWNGVTGGLKTAWTDVRDFLTGSFTAFASTAGKLWTSIANAVSTAFGAVKGAVGGIWHDVESVFVGAVNFVDLKILNPLIGILNDVLGVFGVKISPISKLTVPGYATGGTVPGYAPGVDSQLIRVSPGEGILVPEAVRGIGGATGVQAINSMFSARVSPPSGFSLGGVVGTLPGFASGGTVPPGGTNIGTPVGGGGLLGGVLGVVSGAGGVVTSIGAVVDQIKDYIRRGLADAAIAALNVAEAPVKALLGTADSSFANTLSSGVFDKLNSAVADYIRGNVKKPTGGPIPTGEHATLIKEAFAAAGVTDSPANEGSVNTIVTHESGWNPSAINLTDSNATAGHPSQGLMQTIPSTFESYRLGSLPDDITDPIANLVAGIRYAISTYGSLENVPGVVAVNNGGSYVGYDAGGFLPPGLSAVFNGTGANEIVAPASTFAQLQALSGANTGSFEGSLYLDSGEFLGRVRGEAHSVVDSRVAVATERQSRGVSGSSLTHLAR